MKLPPALDNIHKMKNAKIIGVFLVFIVDIGLTVGIMSIPGVTVLLIAVMQILLVVVSFLLLYIFGVREFKWLIISGLTIFIVLGIVLAGITTYTLFNNEPPALESENLELHDGTVDPYIAEAGATCTFSVTYMGNESVDDITIELALTQGSVGNTNYYTMDEADLNDTDASDGKDYIYAIDISSSDVYWHKFTLQYANVSVNTTNNFGPITASQSRVFMLVVPANLLNSFCNIGSFFFIIVLLYWWLGTAKEKRKEWQAELEVEKAQALGEEDSREPEPAEDEGEFTCTTCGSSVSESHNFCPQCGEKFEGIEEETSGDKAEG